MERGRYQPHNRRREACNCVARVRNRIGTAVAPTTYPTPRHRRPMAARAPVPAFKRPFAEIELRVYGFQQNLMVNPFCLVCLAGAQGDLRQQFATGHIGGKLRIMQHPATRRGVLLQIEIHQCEQATGAVTDRRVRRSQHGQLFETLAGFAIGDKHFGGEQLQFRRGLLTREKSMRGGRTTVFAQCVCYSIGEP